MVLKKSNKKREIAHTQSRRRLDKTRQQTPHTFSDQKNTRLGDPKRVFGNDFSMRLADLANLDVLLIFVHLGKIAQTGALHHVGAGGHREAQGILNTLGSVVPHGQEGGK